MSNRDASALVPGIRQQSQFSCMEASISAALQALEKPYTEEDVHRILGAEPLRGASWEQALSCCQYFGMRGTLVVPSTIAQLKSWTDAGIPVVIAWTPRDRPWAHASVVYNVDDTHVHVMDPNLPDPNQTSIVLTHEEFYSKWSEKFSDNLIVRRPAMAIEREVTVDGRQVMAGKKELRSQKDRGMSRHLKQGPVRPVDKSDTQSAMSKAQWELRKEEGRAGLPGAGMGAGAHKDKSMYNRGEGKSVDREATDEAGDNDKSAVLFQGLMQKFLKDKKSPKEAPTHGKKTPDPFYDVPPSWEKVRRPKTSQQPLMTRRDYGVTAMLLNTKDFESALRGKTAVNLPADVERYVKEVAEGNPDYTDEQVWATAWSIFCRANPDSEHCHQESYLKAAALNKTAGYSHYWEVKTEIDPAVWAKIVAAAKKIVAAAEAQGIAVRGPMGTGKPEFTDEDIALNGDKSTRNDYESFVLIRKPDGFSFVKTDEKPYDAVVVSILAVAKKLVKGLSVRSDGGSGAIRKVLAKFPRGESMTVDEVAEVVGDEFREMNENPPESVKKVMEGMQGKTAHRPSLLAMDAFAEMLRDGKFEKGKPADPTENMTEEDAAEWERQTEEHKDEFKAAGAPPGRGDDENNAIVTQFFHRSAATLASGKWGFTKSTESACTAGVNKLQKSASRIAKALYAKDESSPAFLAKHATKGGSKTASMILKAMESIGPMAALVKNGKTAGDDFYTKALANGWEELRGDAYAKASRITGADVDFAKKYGRKTVFARYHGTVTLYVVRDDGTVAQDWFMTLPNDGAIKEFVRVSLQEPLEKTAGKSGTGLYGFSEKTAKLGLDACTALHHEAGVIAGDLFARKGADPMKVAGYLAANAKKGKCAYSAMLSEVSPDIDAAVIAKVAASKKKPVKPDTDIEIEEDDGIWAVIGKPSGFVYSTHGSLAQAEKSQSEWLDSIPAQKMKKKKKKASDFLASVDDAEIDGNEEVLDIISKC